MINPYTFSFDKNSKKTYYQQIIYPNDQYQFKDESFFVPRFISTDGKYHKQFYVRFTRGIVAIMPVQNPLWPRLFVMVFIG